MCQSVCPSVRSSVRPSIRPSVRPSFRPPVRSFVSQSVRPSVRPSVSPSVRLSVHPSVSQSVRYLDEIRRFVSIHRHGYCDDRRSPVGRLVALEVSARPTAGRYDRFRCDGSTDIITIYVRDRHKSCSQKKHYKANLQGIVRFCVCFVYVLQSFAP